MPVLTGGAGPDSESNLDDLGIRTTRRLRLLMQMLEAKSFAHAEFDRLRVSLDSLRLAGGESSFAASRLSQARRYLRSNELGAARYELQLLHDCLRSAETAMPVQT